MSKSKNKNSVVIYRTESGIVELRADIEKDTIWATQAQIADLFETTPQNITLHLKSIYEDGELVKMATCKESLQVQKEGGRAVKRQVELYNLDAVIAVGYRINSKMATHFRIWATRVLHGYLVDGYDLNRYRLDDAPEALEGLHEAVAFMESEDRQGKLKGKVTLKLTKDFVPKNNH